MKVFHRHARKCQMNSSNEGATQGQTSYGSVGDPSIFFFFSEGITIFLLHIAERGNCVGPFAKQMPTAPWGVAKQPGGVSVKTWMQCIDSGTLCH